MRSWLSWLDCRAEAGTGNGEQGTGLPGRRAVRYLAWGSNSAADSAVPRTAVPRSLFPVPALLLLRLRLARGLRRRLRRGLARLVRGALAAGTGLGGAVLLQHVLGQEIGRASGRERG